MASRLTKHPSGSLMELIKISFPMILTALSANLMIFVDRLILSHYSITAMNAVAASSTTSLVFTFALVSITSISEVFVGQLNGAKKHNQAASPVWQMIWFSLASIFFLIPISQFAAPYIIPDALHEEGLPYFRILTNFGFLMPLTAAISAFYIGIGKTKIISYIVLIGNVINLILDIILVFGVEGYIPAYGTVGAGIATITSEAIQAIILLIIFFTKQYRKKYQTLNCRFNLASFKKCLKVGSPGAISHASEIGAWAIIFYLAAKTGNDYLTIVTIGQNMFLLFMFLIEGVEKGVIAVCSNLIGAKKINKISLTLNSAIRLYVIFLIIIAIPLLIYPNLAIDFFDINNIEKLNADQLIKYSIITFRLIWLYFVLDSLVWIMAGVLTSAGDTRFIMIANSICSWIFGVLPFYFIVYKFQLVSPGYVWMVNSLYAVVNLFLIYWRYKSGIWKTLKLI